MSGVGSPVETSRSAAGPIYHWWHAALFWLLVNAPGWVVPWRESLFPDFKVPALRPPGQLFPIIWFIITVAALWAGLRILNDRTMRRRRLHQALQAIFWLAYLVFPLFFFGLSSSISALVLTIAIFLVAVAEVALLWSDDRPSALLLLPLLLWSGFAGLYIAPVQALWNPDPLFGTPALFRPSEPAATRP